MINGNDDTAGGQILDEAPTADAEQRITYNVQWYKWQNKTNFKSQFARTGGQPCWPTNKSLINKTSHLNEKIFIIRMLYRELL